MTASASLFVRRKARFSLVDVKVLGASDEQLLEISRELGLALSLHEMKMIKKHFSRRGRNPTDLELQTIGQRGLNTVSTRLSRTGSGLTEKWLTVFSKRTL